MRQINDAVGSYALFIAKHPYIMLVAVAIILIIAFNGMQRIQMADMDNSDILPDDIPVMQAFNVISDSFGGDNSVKIAIELDPRYIGSSEPRDVRDPEVIRYMKLLEESAEHIEHAKSASSAASLLMDLNGGDLPKTKRDIVKLTKDNALFNQYLSRDYELAVVNVRLVEDYDNFEVGKGLIHVIESVPRPPGLIVSPAGEAMADVLIKDTMSEDMNKTSMYSLIGILLVLILLFRSLKYSLTPLSTILVGVIWAFGYIGFMGINMTSATSGVSSMIMGIGIDFGIQTITRFRQELRRTRKEEALKVTMQNVLGPMATTTIAALIGFTAMGMGTLSLMGDMANMMSYGITACFLAAITVVPALLIVAEGIGERYKRIRKRIMRRVRA